MTRYRPSRTAPVRSRCSTPPRYQSSSLSAGSGIHCRSCYANAVRWFVILALVVACSRDERAPAPPAGARLISLTPSATEIVAALGAADQLVGVDEYSKFPPGVDKLPKV